MEALHTSTENSNNEMDDFKHPSGDLNGQAWIGEKYFRESINQLH